MEPGSSQVLSEGHSFEKLLYYIAVIGKCLFILYEALFEYKT